MSANSDRPFKTLSAFNAPASTPKKFEAANGSRITGTFAVDGFSAPSICTARSTASSATGCQARSSSPRVIVNENPVCVSSPATAKVTATAHASVRAYSRSTPSVVAIATRDTASPTWARSSFVTRGSRETV